MKNNHKKILSWVNEQRKTLDLRALKELPKGILDNPYLCPIAASLSSKKAGIEASVGSSSITIIRKMTIPKSVISFFKKLKTQDENFEDSRLEGFLNKSIDISKSINPPRYIKKFINNFDNGKFPELEIKQ